MNTMCQRRNLSIAVLFWLMLTLFVYNISHTSKSNSLIFQKEKEDTTRRERIPNFNGSEDFLILTPGCTIPNFLKTLKFKEHQYLKQNCNERIVFVKKTSDDEIIFRIENNKKLMPKNTRLNCSYQFGHRTRLPGQEEDTLAYTTFKQFQNGTIVKMVSEIVVIECDYISTSNHSHVVSNFKDAYLILKKLPIKQRKEKLRENVATVKENWNVMMVVLDTMSRARAYHSLPKTVNYLKRHHWLDYRGYQKIAFNTFPNTMAILAGKNASSAYRSCGHGMDQCRHSLIWEKFRQAGYVTASGEDYLRLPDTFAPYKGFTISPTDHYARPFFLVGEYLAGNIICSRNKPSGHHLIEYASQFAEAYRNDSFFGFFWINSYSHNLENLPNLFENSLIEFFAGLNKTGVLDNTFVFFLSDHGIRFGEMRLSKESFYEERMPMLFMWVPYEFRELHQDEYYNLQLNQYRLTSPYNLHATLWKLLKLSNKDVDVVAPEACLRCKSLTEEIPLQMDCKTARIDEKWCTCHAITETENDDATAKKSLQIAVEYIQNRSRAVKTQICTECTPLTFHKVIRSHSYLSNNKTYYIVAFALNPNDVAYEATVEYTNESYKILDPTDTISPYNARGSCVVKRNERPYCVCRPIKKCNKNTKKT